MSRRLMSLICLGMYCLCLWLAVQTVEKVRQISPGVSLRYAQALTGEQVKKAQTYIKSSQNTDGLMVTFWEETQVAVRSPVSTRTCTDVCSIGFCGTAHDAYGASYVVGTAPGTAPAVVGAAGVGGTQIPAAHGKHGAAAVAAEEKAGVDIVVYLHAAVVRGCLLYTSDAADE